MKTHPIALASIALTALLVGCNDNTPTTPANTASVEDTQATQTSTFTLGEQVRGEITTQNPVNFKDGSRFQVFDFEVSAHDVAEGNLLEVTLRGALNGTLSLFDGSELIATSSGYERVPMLRSLIQEGQSLQLIVHGQDANSYGPFSLSSKILSVSVSLDQSKLHDLPVSESSWLGEDTQELRFSVEQAGVYRIDLASDEFDTFLKLSGVGVSIENDDGPDGTNSQLVTFLEVGEYTLSIQSYSEGTGLFTVSVEEESLPEGVELQNSGQLPLGNPVFGMLSQTENIYTLDITDEGVYEISLVSDNFDAYLELEGEELYVEDDDGGDGTNALLAVELPTGSYTLKARSFSGHSMGFYTLEAHRID